MHKGTMGPMRQPKRCRDAKPVPCMFPVDSCLHQSIKAQVRWLKGPYCNVMRALCDHRKHETDRNILRHHILRRDALDIACVYVCMCVCVSLCACVSIHPFLYAGACLSICLYIHTYKHPYIDACIRTYIHTTRQTPSCGTKLSGVAHPTGTSCTAPSSNSTSTQPRHTRPGDTLLREEGDRPPSVLCVRMGERDRDVRSPPGDTRPPPPARPRPAPPSGARVITPASVDWLLVPPLR